MPVRVWREVIVPLLGRVSAVLVGISTPLDSFNFFSKLIKMTNPKTGKPLFLTAVIELSCNRCKDKGRAHLCRHKMKFLPPWKSRKNQDVTDMLLRDQQTTIARESMGVVMDEGVLVFFFVLLISVSDIRFDLSNLFLSLFSPLTMDAVPPGYTFVPIKHPSNRFDNSLEFFVGNSIIEKQFLDRWFDGMERYRPLPNQKAPTVVIAIDPNGSAAKTASEMAMVSIAMRWNSNVVSFFLFVRSNIYISSFLKQRCRAR